MMSDNNSFDFTLIGSSIQARLVAGLLCHVHKAKVCLIVDPSTPHRLNREICLSVDCITRPQTWQILAQARTQTFKLLTHIAGRGALERVDPIIVAGSDAGAQALAHMYPVARESGVEIERVRLAQLPDAEEIFRIRGARIIESRLIVTPLVRWLKEGGVTILADTDLTYFPRRGGGARVKVEERAFETSQIIIADEQALARFARPADLSPHFVIRRATAILTQPIPSVSERCIISPRDRFLAHGLDTGSFEIVAHAPLDDMAKHIVSSIPNGKLLRPAGRTVFESVISADGAPFVGKLGQGGVWAIAGFGGVGAFLSAGVARFLAGKSTDTELEYFSERGGGASRKYRAIAEYQDLRAERAHG